MSSRVSIGIAVLVCGFGFAALHAGAAMSEQQADAFARKMAQVREHAAVGVRGARTAIRRTPFTESEVNSWFAYRGQEVLPVGLTQPRLTIVGNGRVQAEAIVDVEAIAKQRSTGRTLDPWSFLGGRVPVTLSGVLHTQDGMGRFDLEEAAISGVPVPRSLLQDMVSYYSRSPEDPQGVRLDEPFRLPARIRQIEVGQGQAVVVQ